LIAKTHVSQLKNLHYNDYIECSPTVITSEISKNVDISTELIIFTPV